MTDDHRFGASAIKALFCVLMTVILVTIMSVATAHAHDDHDHHHDDPAPAHTLCDICIVASSEDDDIVADAVEPPFNPDGTALLSTPLNSKFVDLENTVNFDTPRSAQSPPRNAEPCLDPARAPPH